MAVKKGNITTANEKDLLDYVLDEYRDGVFELFNIITRKLD